MSENANQVAHRERPARLRVQVDMANPISLYLDTGVFNQLQRVALLMTSSQLVPKHLQSSTGTTDKLSDCFMVVAQAFRWKLDPFAVAQHTYVVSGKLGYEGKLIAALINSSPRIDGSLRYEYSGEPGKTRGVRVSGKLKGEDIDRALDGSAKDWRTTNERWTKAEDQQLAYRGAREWARRFMPELILGIFTSDELEGSSVVDGASADQSATVLARALTEQAKAEAGTPVAQIVDDAQIPDFLRREPEKKSAAAAQPSDGTANAPELRLTGE